MGEAGGIRYCDLCDGSIPRGQGQEVGDRLLCSQCAERKQALITKILIAAKGGHFGIELPNEMPVALAKMVVTRSSDVSATPEVKGDRFVVRSLSSLNPGTFNQEASIPIKNAYVSSRELDAALRKIGAFLE